MEDFNKKWIWIKIKSILLEILWISYIYFKKVRIRFGNNGGYRFSNVIFLRLVDLLVLLYYFNLFIRFILKIRFFFLYVGLEFFNMYFCWVKCIINGKIKFFDKGSKINREVRLFFEFLKYDWRICDL